MLGSLGAGGCSDKHGTGGDVEGVGGIAPGAGGGRACQSRQSPRAITSSSRAASVTVRAIGPTCATVPKGDSGQAGTRPNEGLIPNTPAKLAGMRIDPPPSVPKAKGA